MRLFNRELLIIFIPTLLFLIVFTGFYLLLRMNFSLSSDYESFAFVGRKLSNLEILLIGFKNLQELVYFILLTTIFAIISGGLIRNQMIKKNSNTKVALHSLLLTILLALFYMGYKLLYSFYSLGFDKVYFSIYWKDIKTETIVLFLSYFLISIPTVFLFSKQIAKSLRFAGQTQPTT